MFDWIINYSIDILKMKDPLQKNTWTYHVRPKTDGNSHIGSIVNQQKLTCIFAELADEYAI